MRAGLLALAVFVSLGVAGTGLPSAEMLSYLGGTGEDSARDVVFDGAGNFYATGGTNGAFVTTDGTQVNSSSGGASCGAHDVWISKWGADDELEWSTVIGGSGYDRAYAIEVHESGVFVAGRAGQSFPVSSDSLQPNFRGDSNINSCYGTQDGFVAKYSHTGTLLWSTYFGDSGRGFIRDIDVDSLGSVYLVMAEAAADGWVSGDAYDSTHNGGVGDGLVAKLSPDGRSLEWGTFIGGSGLDLLPPSIKVHKSSGLVVITGYTTSRDYPTTPNAPQRKYGGGEHDIVLSALGSNGRTLVFSTYVGGSGDDKQETNSLALSGDRIFIAGTTYSSNMRISPGAISSSNDDRSAFVHSYDLAGRFLAGTYLGGNGKDNGEGLIARGGNVWVAGNTESRNFLVPRDAAAAQQRDGFLLGLNEDLTNLIAGFRFGGSKDDEIRALAVNQRGSFLIAGHTHSTDLPVQDDSSHRSAGKTGIRGRDAFVGRFELAEPFANPRLASDSLFSAVLPGSRATLVGGEVTAFLAIVNSGSQTRHGCGIDLAENYPVEFQYQLFDPGSPSSLQVSPSVSLSPAEVQSFLMFLDPLVPLDGEAIEFAVRCDDGRAAEIVRGLNTLSLTSGLLPTADIVALVATLRNDGIVRIGAGTDGSGVFTVATTNLGTAANVRVRLRTDLGLDARLCETDPATSVCLSMTVDSEISLSVESGANNTFAVFVRKMGEDAWGEFDPASHRLIVEFEDSRGRLVGSTSVAVLAL